MIEKYMLPFQFDPLLMQVDLLGFSSAHWISHFNKPYYEGNWSAIPLRSVNGDPGRIFSDPSGKSPYLDTPHRKKTPYLDSVISFFPCEICDVRLMRLMAGSSIKQHRDYGLNYEDGEVRIHIPVITHLDVKFYLNDECVVMQEGECWYLNFDLPHRVENRSILDRVHLVIDCKRNDWIEDIFEKNRTAYLT